MSKKKNQRLTKQTSTKQTSPWSLKEAIVSKRGLESILSIFMLEFTIGQIFLWMDDCHFSYITKMENKIK